MISFNGSSLTTKEVLFILSEIQSIKFNAQNINKYLCADASFSVDKVRSIYKQHTIDMNAIYKFTKIVSLNTVIKYNVKTQKTFTYVELVTDKHSKRLFTQNNIQTLCQFIDICANYDIRFSVHNIEEFINESLNKI